MTLAFLAGYRPPTFGTVGDGPEPLCTVCGGSVGIFLGYGTDWHHFRGTGTDGGGPAEVYDTDHAPAIGWRYVASSRLRPNGFTVLVG